MRTKADLCSGENAGSAGPETAELAGSAGIAVSAKTGFGLEALKAAIVARLEALAETRESGGANSPGDASLAALIEVEALLASLGGFGVTSDLVLVGNALRSAAGKLGEIVGATYSSDLLDRLFSRFCVGK